MQKKIIQTPFPRENFENTKLHNVQHISGNALGLMKFEKHFFGNWKKILVESESKMNLSEITQVFPGNCFLKITSHH